MSTKDINMQDFITATLEAFTRDLDMFLTPEGRDVIKPAFVRVVEVARSMDMNNPVESDLAACLLGTLLAMVASPETYNRLLQFHRDLAEKGAREALQRMMQSAPSMGGMQ